MTCRVDLTASGYVLTPGDILITSGVNTYQIHAPLFGNKEELQVTRIQRETRGGKLITYRDVDWPELRTFRYKFADLTVTERDNFFTFLNLSLGLIVTIQDYEGRTWTGVINQTIGQSEALDDDCDHTLEFDFVKE